MSNKYLEKVAFLRNPAQAFTTFKRRTDNAVIGGIGKSIAGGAIPGAAIGGSLNKKNETDGKVHRVRNALSGAVVGGYLGGALRGAAVLGARDGRANKIFHKARAKQYGRPAAAFTTEDNLAHFGAKPSHFTTKAEAAKHFKSKMHKAHPDKPGGNTELFKKLSTARDSILKSDWFEKLAMENMYLCKVMEKD